MKVTTPNLAWNMITVASLIDECNTENKFKMRKDKVLIEYKNQFWKLELIKK